MRKVLLIVVAILLLASIGLACTTEYVPEPEVRCTIIRDNYGVPHVYADTKEDLAYGAGYAMAQDRLWQADCFRRTAEGRLAELLGPSVLAQDIQFRTMWYNQDELSDMYKFWDPGTGHEHLKPMIEAYVDGINAYIAKAQHDSSLMPIEYVGKGLTQQLEDFTVADVAAVTVLMAWQFGGTGGKEGDIYTALQQLMTMNGQAAGQAIWSDLFPLNDANAPVTIPGETYEAETMVLGSTSALALNDGLSGLCDQYAESKKAQDALLQSLGLPTKFGSDAVLVSPDLSQSGNALELGGPQMGYTVPQIVYELGLHGAGINAQGMAFPGAGPFILIGVSDHGAWTSTTGSSDVIDTRVLTLNPSSLAAKKVPQYWHDGAWNTMAARVETIYGFKKETSQKVTCYRSVYGPVVAMNASALTAFTLQTPFYENEIAAEEGWQLFQEATDIEQFEDAVHLIIPSHNFYWADTDGNIGYWHAGRFPVKPAGADPRLPSKGDGTQEWVRVTDPDEMPECINPEQGWLTNWNNKPIAGWPYAESDIGWGEGFRVQILMGAMTKFAALGDITTDTLNTVNQIAGYHNTAGMDFGGSLIAKLTAYCTANPGDVEVAAALGQIAAWATATPLPVSSVDFVSPKWPTDQNPTYDHAGLTIFNKWYDKVVPAVFAGILPANAISTVKSNPSLLLRVFRKDASLLYPGYPTGAALDTIIVNALKDAITDLKTQYASSNMSTWLTPVTMETYTAQGALPVNVFSHPHMNRGTYNQIAELSAVPDAKSVIPPGQSGWMTYPGIPSPHAYDQVALYASWTYKFMLLTYADVVAREESRTVFYK